MDTKEKLQEIFKRYLAGKCSPDEIHFLLKHFGAENQKFLDELVLREFEELGVETEKEEAVPERVYQEIENRIQLQGKPKIRKIWSFTAIAASIALVLFAGLYFSKRDFISIDRISKSKALVNDIAPGKNMAKLTLPNGKVIVLSEEKTGLTIDANKLTYNDGTEVTASEGDDLSNMNEMTISTPRGGQYKIKLPDGTDVWLNASSSITYKVQLVPRAVRLISLKGEAYFEVNKNHKYPFVVSGNGQEVEVLGTHFNIKAYEDESDVKTTLMEGSVKVSSLNGNKKTEHGGVRLVPGQQSTFFKGELTVKEVNVENVLSWKSGLFMFNDESLEEAMLKISRWYAVEVNIKDEALAQQGVYGTISKYSSISKVLNMLELVGNMHFELKNNIVTVSKK